jgi:hypothetical protein
MTRNGGARQFGLVAALLALWTLSVHAVLPGLGRIPAAAGQVICTLHGAQDQPTAPVQAAADCCTHCLAAIIPPPEPPRLPLARLGWTIVSPAVAPQAAPAFARIPPRPPGQGPPTA